MQTDPIVITLEQDERSNESADDDRHDLHSDDLCRGALRNEFRQGVAL